MRSRVLYWIFFIGLISINTLIFRFIYLYTIGLFPDLYRFDLITIILFLITVLPISAYFSEKMKEYAITKGLDQGRGFVIFISIIIIVPVTVFTVLQMNDYKEKGLNDVLQFQTNQFDSLVITGGNQAKWRTDKLEHAEEFYDFLSQYRVQKMKKGEWNSDVSKEKGVVVTSYDANGGVKMISLFENRLVFYNNSSYYHVTNGPIDMDWIERFQAKYQ